MAKGSSGLRRSNKSIRKKKPKKKKISKRRDSIKSDTSSSTSEKNEDARNLEYPKGHEDKPKLFDINDPEDTERKVCTMMGATGLGEPKKTFKDIVNEEVNRPLSHFELMLLQSSGPGKVIGCRMLDNDTPSKAKPKPKVEPKPKAKKKKKSKRQSDIEPRYLKVFEQQIEEREKDEREEKFLNDIKTMKKRPSEFGIWDTVSDPVSVVSNLERLPSASKRATSFEEQIRIAQIEAEKRAEEKELVDKDITEVKVAVSLKDHSSTGKYLHENDIAWCQRYTALGQKETIKWFKKFRKVCNHKGNLPAKGLSEIYHRLYDGNGDKFAKIIFKWYGKNSKDGSLDFKDFLVVIEATHCETGQDKLKWMSRLLDLDNTKRVHLSKLDDAMSVMDLLQDPIPEEYYDDPKEYLSKKTALVSPEPDRTRHERFEMLTRYLNFDVYDCISLRAFRAIPMRLISAREF